MAQKIPRNVAIGVAAGGALLIVAIAAFVIFTKKPAPKPGDNGSGLGADTVQVSPPPGTTPTQVASAAATPVSSPAPSGSPAAVDPLLAPQSLKPAGPAASVHFEDAALKFDATFPGPAADPVIANRLKDTQGYLDATKREAARKRGKGDGKWRFIVKWYETARAGDLVSMIGIASEDRAGAHPVSNFDTYIARSKGGDGIRFDDMTMPDHTPSAALTIAICEGLKAAKQKRIGKATIFDAEIVCVGPNSNAKTDEVLKLLAASTQPNKFGGAYIYYKPDTVGPYAEGSYDFVVPQSVFAADLRPDYKPLFAGEPVKPDIN